MKTVGLFLLLTVGLISAQYLTISSCNDYSLGSYLGHQALGVYPIFPLLNFTVFNTTVTRSSDIALYKNLCNGKDNAFYGFNVSLQTCSNQSSSSAAGSVWNDTGFSVQNVSANISIDNQSRFTYIPVNATSSDLTSFYRSNATRLNNNKIVNVSNSNNSVNSSFYGLGFNPTSKCYFPINLPDSNFSIAVTSNSSNGSLVLIQTQNETFNLDNSSGSWVSTAWFSRKTFNYTYTGQLPNTFNVLVERLYDPSVVMQLFIPSINLLINFSDVKSTGIGVNYRLNGRWVTPELLNEADPFDLKISNVNGWNVELKADPSFDSTLTSSYSVSVVNVTITPVLGYVQKAIQYGKNLFNILLTSSNTPSQAQTNGEAQLAGTKLALEEYQTLKTKCDYDLNTALATNLCTDLPSCLKQLGRDYPGYPSSNAYNGYSSCDQYARSQSHYNGRFMGKNSKKFSIGAGVLLAPWWPLGPIAGVTGGFAAGKIRDHVSEKRMERRLHTINLLKPKIKNAKSLSDRFNSRERIKTLIEKFKRKDGKDTVKPFENNMKRF